MYVQKYLAVFLTLFYGIIFMIMIMITISQYIIIMKISARKQVEKMFLAELSSSHAVKLTSYFTTQHMRCMLTFTCVLYYTMMIWYDVDDD